MSGGWPEYAGGGGRESMAPGTVPWWVPNLSLSSTCVFSCLRRNGVSGGPGTQTVLRAIWLPRQESAII